jgi:tRNA pseudouridine38-40 synthase
MEPSGYAMLLCYDGTAYHGWQVQKNAVSVCSTIQDAMSEAFGVRVKLHGCGRTDAGVHAKRYVAGFRAPLTIPAERIPLAVNPLLPRDISILRAARVPPEFNAIGSCIRKEYTYSAYTAQCRDPFADRYAYHFPRKLDIAAMSDAAGIFRGRHDFSAFRTSGSTEVLTTVRTVFDSEIISGNGFLHYRVSADGFLYNMARAIAGTLLYVGIGKIDACQVSRLLEGGKRADAGPTAPPHGLSMTGTWYDVPLPW